MRILSIGTHLFSSLWRDLGHTVLCIADYTLPVHPDNRAVDFFGKPEACAANIAAISESFKPDVIFQGDRSTPLIHCGLENFSMPKVWYAIDTHLHHAWHCHYAAVFDTVFLTQKNMLPRVLRHAARARWLPCFSQVSPPFTPWQERTIDAAFVGTMDGTKNPERVAFFEALEKAGAPVQVSKGGFVPVYTKAKVVVNQSVADDLNLRFFEAAACGALVITDRLSWPVNDILEEAIDFLAYEHGNAIDCAEKIRWALAHPAQAEAMAVRAHGKVIARHLVKHRAATVLEEMQLLAQGGEPLPARDLHYRAAHLAWAYYYCSELALPPAITRFFTAQSEILAARGRPSPDARGWALLANAGTSLNRGDTALARSLLLQCDASSKNSDDFRINVFSLRIRLCVHEGTMEEARILLDAAKKEFPDEKIFKEEK